MYSDLLVFCCQNLVIKFCKIFTFHFELLFELFLSFYHYEYHVHLYFGLFRVVNHAFFKCPHCTITSCFSHSIAFNITTTLYSFFLQSIQHYQCNSVYILLLLQPFFPLNPNAPILIFAKDNLSQQKQLLLSGNLLHQ